MDLTLLSLSIKNFEFEFEALDIAHPQNDKWISSPSKFSSSFTV